MVASHTPGPWAFDPEINRVYSEATGACVALIHIAGNSACEEAWPADARLIAAAPQMLAALRSAEQFVANGIELGFIRVPDASTPDAALLTPDIIRDAIAKAEAA